MFVCACTSVYVCVCVVLRKQSQFTEIKIKMLIECFWLKEQTCTSARSVQHVCHTRNTVDKPRKALPRVAGNVSHSVPSLKYNLHCTSDAMELSSVADSQQERGVARKQHYHPPRTPLARQVCATDPLYSHAPSPPGIQALDALKQGTRHVIWRVVTHDL